MLTIDDRRSFCPGIAIAGDAAGGLAIMNLVCRVSGFSRQCHDYRRGAISFSADAQR